MQAPLGVMREDNALTVGGNGQIVSTRVAPLQLAVRALEQIRHPTRANFEDQNVGHTAHRHVVIPMAIDRILRGIGRVLALGECFKAGRLVLDAARLGPDPGNQRDAPTIREPPESADSRWHLTGPARFAPIRGNQVELRGVVLFAVVLPSRDERDPFAGGGKSRLTVFVPAGGQLFGRQSGGRQ